MNEELRSAMNRFHYKQAKLIYQFALPPLECSVHKIKASFLSPLHMSHLHFRNSSPLPMEIKQEKTVSREILGREVTQGDSYFLFTRQIGVNRRKERKKNRARHGDNNGLGTWG